MVNRSTHPVRRAARKGVLFLAGLGVSAGLLAGSALPAAAYCGPIYNSEGMIISYVLCSLPDYRRLPPPEEHTVLTDVVVSPSSLATSALTQQAGQQAAQQIVAR